MNRTMFLYRSFSWQGAALLMGPLLLVLFALYWPTFHSMVEIWERSETFTHGFLVFPISLWLIWGRRQHLAALQPGADWRGVALMALAGAAWLLADAGGVRVAAQYAFITLLIGAVWSVMGLHIVRSLFFPLTFLYFAVPVGEFLIPPLIEFTADFTVGALQLTGIPVYREGTHFSLPSGDWSVVEACSGLRYLIASVTLGSLYAYLTYRSWKRRLMFALLSILAPLLANGLRAYMIVMIGHLSGMKYAVGVDHLIYGWVFFGVVMFLLFWVGSYWREDESDTVAAQSGSGNLVVQKMSMPVGLLLATLLAAAVWPAYSAYLNQRALPETKGIELGALAGWEMTPPFTDWRPHWVGADQQQQAGFASGSGKVFVAMHYYATQRQDAELINSQNLFVGPSSGADWIVVGESPETVTIADQPRKVHQALLKSADHPPQRLLVWQWNMIGGKPAVSEHLAKIELALKKVTLRRDDGVSLILAAPYDTSPEAAAAVLTRFARENEAKLMQAISRTAGK